jgi:hypothetical protein
MAKSRPKKKTPRKPCIDIYAVFWVDAIATPDEAKRPLSPIPAVTFGVVEKADDEQVQVAGEFFANRDTRLRSSLPAGMVSKLVKVGQIALPVEFAEWREVNDGG